MLFFIKLLFLLFSAVGVYAKDRSMEMVLQQGKDIIITQVGKSHDVAFRYNKGREKILIHKDKDNEVSQGKKIVLRHNGKSQLASVEKISRRQNVKNYPRQKTLTNFANLSSYNKNSDFLYTDRFYLIKSDWQTIDGLFTENWKDVVEGYKNVCKAIQSKPDDLPIKSQLLQLGTVRDLKYICRDLYVHKQNNQDYQQYFINNFVPYLIGDDEKHATKGLFTGYYYPTLNASRVKTHKYKYPIYSKPKELNSRPYYTRKQINDGILNGRGLEIFWVDDFVDLYFLHIQGSGMLKLTDGTYTHVRFAGKNNQPYSSLGKYMLRQKYIKNGSDTKAFLKANEHIAHDILSINESYIFFEENYKKSVVGAHGSELVDGRSLAVDSKYIPYGVMLFVDTKNQSKVMYAQDTGSAIKGKIRGDIFVGKGSKAGDIAKSTYKQGTMYLLVHKDQKLSVLR